MPTIEVDPQTHLIRGVRYLPSPNCDERPDPEDIGLLVVHGISLPPNEFGGAYIEQFFTNQLDCAAHPYFSEIGHLHVSAHLLIRRNGELIQFVPFDRRAWHAGESSFESRACCNDFSIGIELEGADHIPYSEEQYARLAAVTRALQSAYPGIGRDRIVGHCDIAPQRKSDPGPAFIWAKFFQILDDQNTAEA